MKKVIFAVMFLSFVTIFASQSFAVPIEINYQGYLTSAGVPVNVPTNMTFMLYDNLDAPQWDSGMVLVPVVSGVYNVVLGATPQPAINPAIFALDLWLGVTIGGDAEMAPKQKLTSVSYSIKAGSAEVADSVIPDAITSTEIATWAVGTDEIADGAVTIDKIDGGAVGNEQILDDAITGSQISDGSIADADISPTAHISSSKISDGSGSGMDADLLDGQHGTYYTDWNNLTNIPQVLSSLSCTDGQVAKYIGSVWTCVTEPDYLLKSGDLVLGTLHMTENTILGNNFDDTIIYMGRVNSSILPTIDNNYDLGSSLNRWGNVYADNIIATTISGDGSNLTNFAIDNLSDAKSDLTNLFLGFKAGLNNTEGNYNTVAGVNALVNNTGGHQNTAIGYSAMALNLTAMRNTAVGALALSRQSYDNGGIPWDSFNTAVGYEALYSNLSTDVSNGESNTAVGALSLHQNTTGSGNTSQGKYALYNNLTGNLNTAVGARALMYNTTGDGNVSLGTDANLFNQTGSSNTIIGYEAGRGATLHSKTGNVFLGYQAGYNETGSNKLYIDNSNTSSPLIYGDFATDYVKINGDLEVTGQVTASDINPGFGVANGIQFPNNPVGGSGDGAWIEYYQDGSGEDLALQIGIANDGTDDIEFHQSGAIRMSIENGDVYVTQNLAVDGVLQLTPQTLPSNCSQTGAVYFSASYAEPCYCNGSVWRQFDGGGNC